MNTITVAVGYALTVFTFPSDSWDLVVIETLPREVPYISMDTCVRDNNLSLLTYSKVIRDPSGGRVVSICTPVLEDKVIGEGK